MPHGLSIHVGVNKPKKCSCSEDRLHGAERGALAMAELARHAGFEVVPPLLGKFAVWHNLQKELEWAARRLIPEDILLLSFSGHGCRGRLPSPCDEPDCHYESWCLADGEARDRSLLQELARFEEGVRILAIADCCHSEGSGSLVLRGPLARLMSPLKNALRRRRSVGRSRVERPAVTPGPPADNPERRCILSSENEFKSPTVEVKASILVLASCRREELALDDTPNSLFMGELRRVWNGGRFQGTYASFLDEIHRRVASKNGEQNPACAWSGKFPRWYEEQVPFTI